jgi:pimeloyl-ACP methyl ester carboxylesterase
MRDTTVSSSLEGSDHEEAPMTEDRIHRTTSADGTMIAGRVHGQGPPLVLVPGGPTDGDMAWASLLPHLTGSVACFALDLRGRGLSGDDPDHSRERLVEDVVAFVESIPEEVALFGHSAGGPLVMEAASRARNVRALALYEPALLDLADEQLARRYVDAFTRVRRAAEEGRPAEGAQIFLEELALANDQELRLLADVGATQGMAPLVGVVLREEAQSGLPQLGDPAVLNRIDRPVLVLHGTRTHPVYTKIVRFLARRLADCRSHELPGLGHLGPEVQPEPVAEVLVHFIEQVMTPQRTS